MRLVIAQSNLLVGDIEGNCEKVLALARQAVDEHQAELVVFPELALTGYPPEDLLLRPSLNTRVREALEMLSIQTPVALLLGYPAIRQGVRVNVAGFIEPGSAPVEYVKQYRPNYRVFDEKRYFRRGQKEACLIPFGDLRLAVLIGEDIRYAEPLQAAATKGADLVINLAASPYCVGKHDERQQTLCQAAQQYKLPILFCNLVGGQDELVFDGGAMVVSAEGEVVVQAPLFETCLWPVEIATEAGGVNIAGVSVAPPQELAALWQALVLALQDYVNKNGFAQVALGLSGGIDSALVLALAVEALGAERVQAVMMPYHYTAPISVEDAQQQAQTLGVRYQVVPIEPAVSAFEQLLQPVFDGQVAGLAKENLQARCRGVLLMAISNQQGALVLPTSNKSEMAVGYSTLYGDMVGGFAVLRDVSKTRVYQLARYCNEKAGKEIIPERVITRPPSAELAPGQTDQDSLPDYDVLDAILTCYVEQDMSAEATIRAGHDRDTVYRIVRLVDRSEYKRRQAAIGPRISQRSFGKDRRYPITNGWRPGD